MNWKNKTILVTGATGFLGAHLAQRLASEKSIVTGLTKNRDLKLLKHHGIENSLALESVDITKENEVSAVFENHSFDYCFHLAGIASPSLVKKMPEQSKAVNVDGSKNIFNACVASEVACVAVSTAAVYGTQKKVNENSPPQPQELYSQTKVEMEEFLRSQVSKNDFKGVIARPTNIYGPMDATHTLRFVPNNILHALRHEHAQNDPAYIRDFLYISDAIDALLELGKRTEDLAGEALNVSYGASFPGTELEKTIWGLVHEESLAPTPLQDRCISHQRLSKETNWKPRVPIVEGLSRTIDWYRVHASDFK